MLRRFTEKFIGADKLLSGETGETYMSLDQDWKNDLKMENIGLQKAAVSNRRIKRSGRRGRSRIKTVPRLLFGVGGRVGSWL